MFADQLEIVLPELRAYVRVLCGDLVQADDIVQNACEKAWINRADFDESRGPLRAWLFRIARNEFYQQKRFDRVRDAEDRDVVEKHLEAASDVESRSDLYRMLRAIDSLKDAQREAFLLVAAAGFTYDEAGEVLGCAPGTVKSRVSRAREHAIGRFNSDNWSSETNASDTSPIEQLHEALNRIQAGNIAA
ncbi:MAG: sigma-70 family RNA polymerase sigma factor [Pseudomonadota bacterium]|nr:sigma-70 family RNA polymerase sigma factor [Pseudomonadota bacterium]